jgi:transposase-like protein
VCACGCSNLVTWDSSHRRWYRYRPGHYRQPATYKDAAWLRRTYANGQTTWEIAAACGVNHSTILKFMRKYGIARRSRSESRMNRHLGQANTAWKGGVAQWPYSKNWTELANTIRDRDRWTCQDCGECRQRWGSALHVHHIDENKLNDAPANLISLCALCHMTRHGAKKEVMLG